MKKRDRITSFLLVFILTIQLIPAQALAFSTNFATSFTDYGPYEFSIPSEEESQYQNSTDRYYDLVYTPEGDLSTDFPETDSGDNTYNSELKDPTSLVPTEADHHFIEIVKVYSSFLELTPSDQEFLCSYTGIASEMLATLSVSGVSISDALGYASLSLSIELPIEEIIAVSPTLDEINSIAIQAKLYNSYLDSEISEPTVDLELKKFLLQGYSFEQINNAFTINQKYNIAISDLLEGILQGESMPVGNNILTENELSELSDLAQEAGISESAIINYTDQNQEQYSDIKSTLQSINTSPVAAGYENEASDSWSSQSDSSIGSASPNATDDVVVTPMETQYLGAPYTYSASDNEKVSLNTGALIEEAIDYILPGINGLDLVIGRRYNSQEANNVTPVSMYGSLPVYQYYVNYGAEASYYVPGIASGAWDYYDEHYVAGPFATLMDAQNFCATLPSGRRVIPNFEDGADLIFDYYANIVPVLIGYNYITTSGTQPNNYLKSMYGLGNGWSFMFSSIEMTGSSPLLHLSDGRTYEIAFGSTISNLKDYLLSDLRIVQEPNAYFNGQEYSLYTLYYADGTREYFSGFGKLLAKADRYNNTIKFSHSILNGFPYITITDTLNRVTTISGSPILNGHIMTVTLPDSRTMTYTVNYLGNSCDLLGIHTNTSNQNTYYSYSVNTAGFDANSKGISAASYQFANLTAIQHPTGALTQFNYSSKVRNLGVSGATQVFVLSNRFDRTITDSSPKNVTNYSYFSDCSGYPNYTDGNNLPTIFTYSTTVINPSTGLAEGTTFNYKHRPIAISYSNISSNALLRQTVYNYDIATWLPTSCYDNWYGTNPQQPPYQIITSMTYDQYGNVTAEWSPLAEGSTIDTEYKTTYTYGGPYQLLLSKTYKTNLNTTVEERNTLTEDGRSIARTEVYENNVLKSRTDFTYDSSGNVTSQRNYKDGFTDFYLTEYTYESGYLSSESRYDVLDPDGAAALPTPGQAAGVIRRTYTYDRMGRLFQSTDANGGTTTYYYDNLDNVSLILNPDNTSISYTRDYFANTVTVRDEDGANIKYTYTPLGLEYQTIDVQSGAILSQNNYDSASRLMQKFDYTYGSSTLYSYDVWGRCLSESIGTLNGGILSQKLYNYTDAPADQLYQIKTETILGDTMAPSIITNYYTNKIGHPVKTGKMLNGTEYFENYTTDYRGNVVITQSAQAAVQGLGFSEKNEYDYAGRVIKTYNADNQSTSNTYNALGQLIQSTDYSGTPTIYSYDALGRMLTQTLKIDASNSAVTKYYYDAAGNIIRQLTPSQSLGSGAIWNRIDYTYDSRNRLETASLYDGNSIATASRYTYSGTGNPLTMTTGLSSPTASGGSTTTYTYDHFGNVLSETDATGAAETYSYSITGCLISKTNRNGITERYSYDALGRLIGYNTGVEIFANIYSKTGALIGELSGKILSTTIPVLQRTEYSYDSWGRLAQVVYSDFGAEGTTNVTAATPQISYTTQYTHDLAGNRTNMTVQMGDVQVQNVTYTYDTLNRLSTVTEDGALKATYTYDTNGNRASLTYANGVSETYSYNLANWVTGLTNKLGSTTLSSYSYTYFASGNQKTKTDHTGKTTTYTYDGLGRLTAESSGDLSVSYAYDANSNRTQMSVSGPESSIIAYSYDAANRLVSETTTRDDAIVKSISYSYDDNGNLLSKATTGADNIVNTDTFQYNTIDQLISHTSDSVTTSYTYNAQGIRTSKTTGALTSYYVLDEENVVGEVQNGAVTASYLRGVNPILMDIAGSESYYLYNAHSDVVQLTSAAGAVSRSYDYDAFGNELDPDTADINPFRYCGEYRDAESGAYYLRARYYDPSIGRFTQEDTYAGEYKDPLSLNYYTYCYNNPTRFFDRTGNIPVETVLDIASAAQSLASLIADPNLANLGFFAWDVASALLPYVPGSYVAKGAKLVGHIDDISGLTKALSKADNIADAAEAIVGGRSAIVMSYTELRKTVKSLGIKGMEVHHLIEKRFAKTLGIDPDDIPSILLPKGDHQTITKAFRKLIGYSNDINSEVTTKYASVEKIWSVIKEVYNKNGMEQYIPIIEEFLQINSSKFGNIRIWKID